MSNKKVKDQTKEKL